MLFDSAFITFLSQASLTLFVVMDPVGLVPLFIALTEGRSQAENRRIAFKATLVAGIIIVLFAFFGRSLLHTLGINMFSFRIAGGILLFLIALDMVFARPSGAKETKEEEQEAKQKEDISVFPLAIPLMAGPGTLASIMILMGKADNTVERGAVVAVAAVVLGICLLALLSAYPIAKLLGRTGVHVITRVLGVLLAALAVQYVVGGILGFLPASTRS